MSSMKLLILLIIVSFKTLHAWISCLSCSDVVAPANCSNIQRCDPQEECFIEKFVNAVGNTRYNLGCRDKLLCANSSDSETTSVCSECCTGDICNSEGCQNKGFPSPRGPVCTNCPLQRDVGDCDKITTCQQDEVCTIQKKFMKEVHESRYQTKCEKEKVCYTKIRQLKSALESIVRKRQTEATLYVHGDHCLMKCCKTDLCNDNCNKTSSNNQHGWIQLVLG